MSYKILGKEGILSKLELEEKLISLGMDGITGIVRDVHKRGSVEVRGHRILLLKG